MTDSPAPAVNSVQQAAKVASLEITTPPRDLMVDAWYRLIRNKASVASMIFIVILMLVAIFANVLSPHNPIDLPLRQGIPAAGVDPGGPGWG